MKKLEEYFTKKMADSAFIYEMGSLARDSVFWSTVVFGLALAFATLLVFLFVNVFLLKPMVFLGLGIFLAVGYKLSRILANAYRNY